MNWRNLKDPAEIRALLEDPSLDGRTRQTLERALSLIEGYYKALKRKAYRGGVAKLGKEHDEFLKLDDDLDEALADLRAGLRTGRLTPNEAARRLQALHERERQNEAKHDSLMEQDENLAGIYAEPAYDYVLATTGGKTIAENLANRFTALQVPASTQGGVTLGNVVDLLNENWDVTADDLVTRFPVSQ